MNKEIIKAPDMQRFAAACFDRPEESEKATRILKGSSETNYKTIQRFLDNSDSKLALQRLYCEETPYVIGDPAELRDIKPGRLRLRMSAVQGIYSTTKF